MGTDRKGQVLLVEDDDDAAWGMATLLEIQGYHVDVARDVDAGLSLLHEHCPDAVFCDINLGANRPSGYDFARAVRSDPTLSELALISVSGYGQPAHVAESRASGFDQHMVKPVDLAQIEEALKEFVPQ